MEEVIMYMIPTLSRNPLGRDFTWKISA